MKSKKLLMALMAASMITMFASVAQATTVTKLLTGDYIGQTVSVQGKLTEHLNGTFYNLVDYTGEHIRVNLANLGYVDGNRDLTVEGRLSTRDNVLTLEATHVYYDQDGAISANAPTVTVSKLLSSDKYHGQEVILKGRVTEYYNNDYANFVDTKGERVVLKLNGYHIPEGDQVTIHGVPGFNNNRLEISVKAFN